MPFDPALTEDEISACFTEQFSDISTLSSGGQGAVFRGFDAAGSPVAIKVYFPNQLEERTKREVAAMEQLHCPHLVKVHSTGRLLLRSIECVYVVTDFIPGSVLSEVVSRGGLSAATVASIGADIASAIHAMWTHRIVHRDIKPANIMLSSEQATLIDLGLARHLSMDTLTAAGITWGTLGYMAPEHARAVKQLSCKADVFSLGIVLQECLLGRHPTGRQQVALLGGGPPTGSLLDGVPEALADIIDGMIAPSPHTRPMPQQLLEYFTPLREVGRDR